jgi:hypothetical protein
MQIAVNLFVHSWHIDDCIRSIKVKKHPGRNQGGVEKIYSTYCYDL